MKATIRDRAALAALDPGDIATYLEARGWRRIDGAHPGTALWGLGEGEAAAEALAPVDREFDDYATRLAQLLDVLGRVEGRSQLDLLRDMKLVGADVFRVLASQVDPTLDSVPLREGAQLIDRAMEIMACAAASAVAPRRVIPSRKPALADEYMRNVQLGQTETGSYVITIVSRVAGQPRRGQLGLAEFIEVPFPRRVTQTLSSALDATRNATSAVSAGERIDLFLGRVEAGVSANLCEAVAGLLSEVQDGDHVDLTITWAPRNPERLPSAFRFLKREAGVLIDAARYLREEAPDEGILVTGVVTNLHREEGAEAGTARIATVIEGGIRRLVVPLEAPEYGMAIEAHRTKRAVLFKTDVVRVGRGYHATNVQEFRIVG